MANGQRIVTSDAQLFNSFTQTRQMYAIDTVFGAGNGANSTPTIDPADADTYRFAYAMPSIGNIRKIQFYYYANSGGSPTGTFDFTIYNTPWGPLRDDAYDKIYEKKNIVLGSVWDHKLPPEGLPFHNRIGYIGQDPVTGEATHHPRQFLWLELKPNDGTAVAPLVKTMIMFDV